MMRKTDRTMWAAAVAGLMCLVATACSSSSNSTGSDSPASSDTVKVMVSVPLSGSQVVLTPSPVVALKAGVQAINAAGGIGASHAKLQLVVCDNQFDPNVTATCATEAVQDGVAALLATYTENPENLYPILDPANIANIGQQVASPLEATERLSFPLFGSTEVQFGGVGVLMANSGCKKAAVVGIDLPESRPVAGLITDAANAGGVQTVPSTYVPLTSQDFAGFAANLELKNVDCVALLTTPTNTPSAVKAIRQVNPKIQIFGNSINLSAPNVKSLGSVAEGIEIANSTIVPTLSPDASSPQLMKDFAQQINKYGSGGINDLPSAFEAWLALQVFATATKDLTTIDASDVYQAMSKLSYNGAGVMGSFDFGGPPPVPGLPRVYNTKLFQEVVKNGEFVVANPTPFDTKTVLDQIIKK